MIVVGIILTAIGIFITGWASNKARKCILIQSELTKQTTSIAESFNQLVTRTLQQDDRELTLDRLSTEIVARVERNRRISEENRLALQRITDRERDFSSLVDRNTQIVTSNQVFLYNIKESMLNTITDYRKACKLLSTVLYKGDSYEKLQDVLVRMQLKVIALEDSFVSNFKMTPEEYRVSKMNKTGMSLN